MPNAQIATARQPYKGKSTPRSSAMLLAIVLAGGGATRSANPKTGPEIDRCPHPNFQDTVPQQTQGSGVSEYEAAGYSHCINSIPGYYLKPGSISDASTREFLCAASHGANQCCGFVGASTLYEFLSRPEPADECADVACPADICPDGEARRQHRNDCCSCESAEDITFAPNTFAFDFALECYPSVDASEFPKDNDYQIWIENGAVCDDTGEVTIFSDVENTIHGITVDVLRVRAYTNCAVPGRTLAEYTYLDDNCKAADRPHAFQSTRNDRICCSTKSLLPDDKIGDSCAFGGIWEELTLEQTCEVASESHRCCSFDANVPFCRALSKSECAALGGHHYCEPAACCEGTWDGRCYTDRGPANFGHACADCRDGPCHDECDSDAADAACGTCCRNVAHEMPWNCHLSPTESSSEICGDDHVLLETKDFVVADADFEDFVGVENKLASCVKGFFGCFSASEITTVHDEYLECSYSNNTVGGYSYAENPERDDLCRFAVPDYPCCFNVATDGKSGGHLRCTTRSNRPEAIPDTNWCRGLWISVTETSGEITKYSNVDCSKSGDDLVPLYPPFDHRCELAHGDYVCCLFDNDWFPCVEKIGDECPEVYGQEQPTDCSRWTNPNTCGPDAELAVGTDAPIAEADSPRSFSVNSAASSGACDHPIVRECTSAAGCAWIDGMCTSILACQSINTQENCDVAKDSDGYHCEWTAGLCGTSSVRDTCAGTLTAYINVANGPNDPAEGDVFSANNPGPYSLMGCHTAFSAPSFQAPWEFIEEMDTLSDNGNYDEALKKFGYRAAAVGHVCTTDTYDTNILGGESGFSCVTGTLVIECTDAETAHACREECDTNEKCKYFTWGNRVDRDNLVPGFEINDKEECLDIGPEGNLRHEPSRIEVIQETTLLNCAQQCAENSKCTGFEFNFIHNDCIIFDDTYIGAKYDSSYGEIENVNCYIKTGGVTGVTSLPQCCLYEAKTDNNDIVDLTDDDKNNFECYEKKPEYGVAGSDVCEYSPCVAQMERCAALGKQLCEAMSHVCAWTGSECAVDNEYERACTGYLYCKNTAGSEALSFPEHDTCYTADAEYPCCSKEGDEHRCRPDDGECIPTKAASDLADTIDGHARGYEYSKLDGNKLDAFVLQVSYGGISTIGRFEDFSVYDDRNICGAITAQENALMCCQYRACIMSPPLADAREYCATRPVVGVGPNGKVYPSLWCDADSDGLRCSRDANFRYYNNGEYVGCVDDAADWPLYKVGFGEYNYCVRGPLSADGETRSSYCFKEQQEARARAVSPNEERVYSFSTLGIDFSMATVRNTHEPCAGIPSMNRVEISGTQIFLSICCTDGDCTDHASADTFRDVCSVSSARDRCCTTAFTGHIFCASAGQDECESSDFTFCERAAACDTAEWNENNFYEHALAGNHYHACKSCNDDPCSDKCAENVQDTECIACCQTQQHKTSWNCHLPQPPDISALTFSAFSDGARYCLFDNDYEQLVSDNNAYIKCTKTTESPQVSASTPEDPCTVAYFDGRGGTSYECCTYAADGTIVCSPEDEDECNALGRKYCKRADVCYDRNWDASLYSTPSRENNYIACDPACEDSCSPDAGSLECWYCCYISFFLSWNCHLDYRDDIFCCQAETALCKACNERKTLEEYCEENQSTQGCECENLIPSCPEPIQFGLFSEAETCDRPRGDNVNPRQDCCLCGGGSTAPPRESESESESGLKAAEVAGIAVGTVAAIAAAAVALV